MRIAIWKSVWLLAGLAGAANVHADEYTQCTDAQTAPALKGSLCATYSMPASYAVAPTASTPALTLFVRKFPAPGKAVGTVILVAGGPGESGAALYSQLAVLRRSFPGFDLVIPDHRGTGYSGKLCPAEEGPDSDGGIALRGAEWGSCFRRLAEHPELAEQFSITSAAHDLKTLIEHHRGARPLYVYGVSYGTQLVLRTLMLGKLPLAGVILDSLVPLQTAPEWDLSHRSFVVDDIGRKVLAACDANPACHRKMGEPAEALYRRLLEQVQEDPQRLADVPGKNLKQFLGSLLDMPATRARIPYLIKDLEQGQDGELKAVLAQFEKSLQSMGDFPQGPASIPLVSIISASENNLRPALTAADLKQEEQHQLFTSRLPGLLVSPALPAYARDRYFGDHPVWLPPVLVVQGTLDPKTHYEGAMAQVAALRTTGPVTLVTVLNAPHFIAWTAPHCFEQAARAFVARRLKKDQRCELQLPAD